MGLHKPTAHSPVSQLKTPWGARHNGLSRHAAPQGTRSPSAQHYAWNGCSPRVQWSARAGRSVAGGRGTSALSAPRTRRSGTSQTERGAPAKVFATFSRVFKPMMLFKIRTGIWSLFVCFSIGHGACWCALELYARSHRCSVRLLLRGAPHLRAVEVRAAVVGQQPASQRAGWRRPGWRPRLAWRGHGEATRARDWRKPCKRRLKQTSRFPCNAWSVFSTAQSTPEVSRVPRKASRLSLTGKPSLTAPLTAPRICGQKQQYATRNNPKQL